MVYCPAGGVTPANFKRKLKNVNMKYVNKPLTSAQVKKIDKAFFHPYPNRKQRRDAIRQARKKKSI